MSRNENVERILQTFEDRMLERGNSLADVGKRTGIPRITMYKWFNREAMMGLDKFLKLVDGLDLEIRLYSKPKQ